MRGEEPTVARWIGGIGWCLALVGTVIAVANIYTDTPRLIPEWAGWILAQIGLVGIFIHAAAENDRLLRQAIGAAGILLLLAGLVLAGVRYRLWAAGLLSFLPGLILVIMFARRETDPQWRKYSLLGIGAAGAIMSLAELIGMVAYTPWITGPGVVLAIIGLLTLAVFMSLEGSTSREAYWTALALGAAGALVFVYALIRSTMPALLHEWRGPTPGYAVPLAVLGGLLVALGLASRYFLVGAMAIPADSDAARKVRSSSNITFLVGLILGLVGLLRLFATGVLRNAGWFEKNPEPFLVPTGVVLMLAGAVYALVSVAFWSDSRLVVLVRREFMAFFYSPIAYIVLIGFTVMGWAAYYLFLIRILASAQVGRPVEEPIVQEYIIGFIPVVAVMVAVPVITMRLFSEEKRTGTLEVMLTAPINEWLLVISKFLGSLMFFLILWLPWLLFLLALRLETGQPFDYRPLLAFGLALFSSACSFIAMGVFFSSLTSNQIISAVLTFLGMMILICFYFLGRMLPGEELSALKNVFRATNFIDMWFETIGGKLALKDIAYHLSASVLWLFMTVKVLEARRWT
jgi:ABC-type transport system involved in multi-copper enzyme maturation permease subunit